MGNARCISTKPDHLHGGEDARQRGGYRGGGRSQAGVHADLRCGVRSGANNCTLVARHGRDVGRRVVHSELHRCAVALRRGADGGGPAVERHCRMLRHSPIKRMRINFCCRARFPRRIFKKPLQISRDMAAPPSINTFNTANTSRRGRRLVSCSWPRSSVLKSRRSASPWCRRTAPSMP